MIGKHTEPFRSTEGQPVEDTNKGIVLVPHNHWDREW
ncbi:MAG: hypothetical protein JWM70_1939, partial [Microbacteriaceae bacterium]|nr:hypothetical protein [Microbacteriaceae bacterium]